jgi:hypothetical protein
MKEPADLSALRFGPDYVALSSEEVYRRYGDRATYLARFEEAANRAVKAGVLLPGAVEGLLAEATGAFPD